MSTDVLESARRALGEKGWDYHHHYPISGGYRVVGSDATNDYHLTGKFIDTSGRPTDIHITREPGTRYACSKSNIPWSKPLPTPEEIARSMEARE